MGLRLIILMTALLVLAGCNSHQALDATRDIPQEPTPAPPDMTSDPTPASMPDTGRDMGPVVVSICDISQASSPPAMACPGLMLDGHYCMSGCAVPECLVIIPTNPVVWRCVARCDECGPPQ